MGKTVAVTPGDSMSQIWPLFLKKTGLKESDFKTVSGDAQTKLNAVMNGQADLLLGYVMDQAIKLQDATQEAGLSDPLRRLRRQHGQLAASSRRRTPEGASPTWSSASCAPDAMRSRRRRRIPKPPSTRC